MYCALTSTPVPACSACPTSCSPWTTRLRRWRSWQLRRVSRAAPSAAAWATDTVPQAAGGEQGRDAQQPRLLRVQRLWGRDVGVFSGVLVGNWGSWWSVCVLGKRWGWFGAVWRCFSSWEELCGVGWLGVCCGCCHVSGVGLLGLDWDFDLFSSYSHGFGVNRVMLARAVCPASSGGQPITIRWLGWWLLQAMTSRCSECIVF